ncbi:phage tail tube protein, partial [Magnetospirillum moscoviense]|uniref:phage tail tube protein n=1 Tax=Magnetospirillum moscoviense TaxID=1437059 RepID=UPI000A4BE2FA
MAKTRAYGADCILLAAFETVYGTLPADGYGRLSFKESSLGAERPLGYDPLLGQGRDAQDPFYEAIKDEGDIGVPLDVRALGFWLKGLFGAPATADNGDGSFDHVFTSGGDLPSRLVAIDDSGVRFRWKDYRHHDKQKVMTLQPSEFIRRFLLHVLPDGFHRIRHYGFLANGRRAAKLESCRRLLAVSAAPPVTVTETPDDYRDRHHHLTGHDLR